MTIDLGFLHSPNGDRSSKRLMGCLILIIGVILGICIIIVSLFFEANETQTSLKVLEYLLISGCSLLGIGVADAFSNALKKK